jgi:hypothetical protein
MVDEGDKNDRWVCAQCVREPHLSEEIRSSGAQHQCDFCGDVGAAISVEELAGWVETAFETHYFRTTDEPDAFQSAMMRDPEMSYEFDREGEDVLWAIAGAAEASEDIAQEVLDILSERFGDFDSEAMGEECEFDPESRYERRGPNDVELQLDWRGLERSLKAENRFFNKEAEALLTRIFSGIEKARTSKGRAVIRLAGPGKRLAKFYRARVFHAGDKLAAALDQTGQELGPPPSKDAVGGRMNPRGVSLFYGATDADAALAEVRPPVGSRVLIGQFDVVRKLRLLDIDSLRSVYVEGSIFDPGYMGRLELAKFLESLSLRMTMPVTRDDEPAEYLITQVIADYLATNPTLDLDGLLYPSVQRSGRRQNVVLFRRASRVEALDRPEGTEVSVHLEEFNEAGTIPDYSVSEAISQPKPPTEEDEFAEFLRISPFLDPFAEPDDDREPALRLALKTLQVHHVEAIKITTSRFNVRRYRYERHDPKF